MIAYVLLALLNGVFIGTSRAINGRLSLELGPFRASFWNHIVGFIFLTTILVIVSGWKFNMSSQIPLFTYLGGFFGALFVAVNSYVFPRIGAIKTVLLVISGQMIAAVLLDYKHGYSLSTLAQFSGIAIIILGVYMAKKPYLNKYKDDKEQI